jgi:hypothetical protein
VCIKAGFSKMKVSRIYKKCAHGRQKHRCVECWGVGICMHGREKHRCAECGGVGICMHGRRKNRCVECGGVSICEHGRQKYRCVECGGVSICEHRREKHRCAECGGVSICEHGKQKYQCFECGGVSVCEHGREKHRCVECGGSYICAHGRQKHVCAECGGSSICPNCKTLPFASTLARCGMRKYDGFCATCFKHLWPDDPRSKLNYEHTKELAVRQAINRNFTGFAHDKCLKTSHCDCTMRRRIDCRKNINGTLLAVECDEYAHRRYDQEDEKARYHDIIMAHGGNMVFIRFNPDLKGTSLEHKLSILIEEIHKQIARIERGENSELLEVVYLFYPERASGYEGEGNHGAAQTVCDDAHGAGAA